MSSSDLRCRSCLVPVPLGDSVVGHQVGVQQRKRHRRWKVDQLDVECSQMFEHDLTCQCFLQNSGGLSPVFFVALEEPLCDLILGPAALDVQVPRQPQRCEIPSAVDAPAQTLHLELQVEDHQHRNGSLNRTHGEGIQFRLAAYECHDLRCSSIFGWPSHCG